MTINRMLTDLADAARSSGLEVIELPGWKTNKSDGGEAYGGVLGHHTGSYDSLTDAQNDLDYAKWLAFRGRDDLDPPLCNLSLSAECKVYVCAAGNANHAGEAKKSGPMPYAEDGNRLYIGIEAMNSGSQGWNSKGKDAHGNTITQYEAYARLCAALCIHYGWSADHVRGHKETSTTGKWDPGLLDMNQFRKRIAEIITEGIDEMANYEKQLDQMQSDIEALRKDVKEVLANSRVIEKLPERLNRLRDRLKVLREGQKQGLKNDVEMEQVITDIEQLLIDAQK